jgi:hypothetical protein
MLGATPSKQVTSTWGGSMGRLLGSGFVWVAGVFRGAGWLEESADILGMGRAFLGLASKELEERPSAAQPMLEAFRGVFESVGQGDFVGDGGSIEKEESCEVVRR